MKDTRKFLELEKKIGYKFKNFQLLINAMTHSSYANEHHIPYSGNNERLEFLGDAVLELTSSEFLFHKFQDMPEGELTKKKSQYGMRAHFSLVRQRYSSGRLSSSGKRRGGYGGRRRDSIVSDAMEALIGAIYLDGGFANAKEFIHKFILNDIENKELFYDSKTTLQEIVQGQYEEDVHYVLVKEEGPDHNKSFFVEAMLGNRVLGEGCGHTKKAAEQQAAYCAIKKLKSKKGDLCI